MDTREARTLIAQVEMISHGSVQAWNPSGGGHNAEKPNPMPPGELHPPHIRLRAELARALTQTQVDRVAQKAREELRAARYTPPRAIYGTEEWRTLVGTDTRTAKEVADEHGITERHVHRLRALCREKAA